MIDLTFCSFGDGLRVEDLQGLKNVTYICGVEGYFEPELPSTEIRIESDTEDTNSIVYFEKQKKMILDLKDITSVWL